MRILYACSLYALFTMLIGTVSAQPGGGGGIIINHILDKDGNVILKSDSALKIRTFYFNKGEGLSVREYTKKDAYQSRHGQVQPNGIFIEPYLRNNGYKIGMPDQYLQLIYHRDTSLFEFRDISMENGIGGSSFLDSLQLTGRSIRFSFTAIHRQYGQFRISPDSSKRNEFYAIQRLCFRLTSSSMIQLSKLGLVNELYDRRFNIVYNKPEGLDSVALPQKPYYVLNHGSIKNEAASIQLNFKDPAMYEEGQSLYRLYLNIRPFDRLAGETYEHKVVNAFLKDLPKKKLLINDLPFTGSLRVYIPFSGFRPGSVKISGTSLVIYHFSNGVMTDQQEWPDVDINDDHFPERPT